MTIRQNTCTIRTSSSTDGFRHSIRLNVNIVFIVFNLSNHLCTLRCNDVSHTLKLAVTYALVVTHSVTAVTRLQFY